MRKNAADWQALGLDGKELGLYEALLNPTGHRDPEALAAALALTPAQFDEACARLEKLGFIRSAPAGRLPAAVSPAIAIRNRIHLRKAELLRTSAELETLTASVGRLAAEMLGGMAAARTTGIETVRGRLAIAERVASLLASATSRVSLLDRPPYAASDPAGTPAPLAVGDLVARGVEVRVVVDREGLSFPGRARGLGELAGQGVQIRLAADLPTKLITVDDQVTLLPPTDVADPTAAALVVSDALLGNALVPLFEAVWERSMPIGPGGSGELDHERSELLTLLASGLKDEAIARRLGVHVHTARRRISRLLVELNAETRFQAGVQALRRGWLTP
ncbi:Homeodomain-like domain-containing protein [Streptomyces sp. 840.1]|uniref:LuxR family transcriptional regulator n=1 Tax=Streptomyces sp. 840.1 TaxID=2485152 RepID=UPI000FB0109C|nr:LuxR family transcriptional regulator [Streptomyces sp. 840.1]ROQ63660.1 Homeodomain-like domain-containing protein [Streptomyces sp. 840.1]